MDSITLKGKGGKEMTFTGRELAHVDDRELFGNPARWWELTLYRTDAGRYVLASAFHITYPDRLELKSAFNFDSARDVEHFLIHEGHVQTAVGQALLEKAAEADQALTAVIPVRPEPASCAWRAPEQAATA
jgi:hypothetical protein